MPRHCQSLIVVTRFGTLVLVLVLAVLGDALVQCVGRLLALYRACAAIAWLDRLRAYEGLRHAQLARSRARTRGGNNRCRSCRLL